VRGLHSYTADDIQVGHHYDDVISFQPNGTVVLDLHRINDTHPTTTPAPSLETITAARQSREAAAAEEAAEAGPSQAAKHAKL
jgi:hypothetical protein